MIGWTQIPAILLLPLLAQAAPTPPKRPEFCGNLEKMIQYVDSCERNNVFSEMALRCAIKLSQNSEKVASDLGKSLSQGDSSQVANMASSASNLKMAQDALAALERKNNLAIDDTLQYFMQLVHPEVLYEMSPKVDGSAVLRKSPCFADNKRKLAIALTAMEENRTGISLARQALDTLSRDTGTDIRGMLQAAFRQVKPAKASAVKEPSDFERKKHKNRQSDITKEEKK